MLFMAHCSLQANLSAEYITLWMSLPLRMGEPSSSETPQPVVRRCLPGHGPAGVSISQA